MPDLSFTKKAGAVVAGGMFCPMKVLAIELRKHQKHPLDRKPGTRWGVSLAVDLEAILSSLEVGRG